MRHLNSIEQLSGEGLRELLRIGDWIRAAADVPARRYLRTLLDVRSSCHYASRSWRRLSTSFTLAAGALGMHTEEVRDASALEEGASEPVALRTLAEMYDVVIVQAGDPAVAAELASSCDRRGLPARIIDASDSADTSPVPALVELYTLASHAGLLGQGGPSHIGFYGNAGRSHVTRSLSRALAAFPVISQVFITPAGGEPDPGWAGYLAARGVHHRHAAALDDFLPYLDVLYTLEDVPPTPAQLQRLRPGAVVITRPDMPAPELPGISVRYWDAPAKGKYIKMAVLLHLFGLSNVQRLSLRLEA